MDTLLKEKLKQKYEELFNVAQEMDVPEHSTVIIVSLEDFFNGNDDIGSIGCNLLNHPGTDRFYEILTNVRGRKNVQDVFVQIYEFEDNDLYWAYSEQIYVLTKSRPWRVMRWLRELEPDAIGEGYEGVTPHNAPQLRPGYKVYGVTWD